MYRGCDHSKQIRQAEKMLCMKCQTFLDIEHISEYEETVMEALELLTERK